MKILLTGASGYIGQRLVPVLLELGHEVVCCVRDVSRFDTTRYRSGKISVIRLDLLDPATLQNIPEDIDTAYYLVHALTQSGDFAALERKSATAFVSRTERTRCRQVIYLTGIVNSQNLSNHLRSRRSVEEILSRSAVPLTSLRAGIIVGSGSASFEIIRDLVEKLPVMVAPKWIETRCQPVAIRNVIEFLTGVLSRPEFYDKHFDIYGPDVLTYREMLLQYASVRGLSRKIITVPVMTPRLSSYWLYFVTSTSYNLAVNLVDSMKVDVVAELNDLAEKLGISRYTYTQAVRMAFDKIEQNLVESAWSDATGNRIYPRGLSAHVEVPEYGCFKDVKKRKTEEPGVVADRIFAIGGETGWYYGKWLWEFRGFLDKLFGGVGLNRGRKNRLRVHAGETIDFWRVLYASRDEGRLLLYAEMRLPGEAWLEFKIDGNVMVQTATFRPKGLWGRIYWYSVLPFHYFVFNGMADNIVKQTRNSGQAGNAMS